MGEGLARGSQVYVVTLPFSGTVPQMHSMCVSANGSGSLLKLVSQFWFQRMELENGGEIVHPVNHLKIL